MLCTMAASFLLGVSAAPLPPAASPGSPSQILVLGMHHSGTSLVSNLTMMMGAFGGKTEDMLLHPENPLKFWERRDVVALDERRVAAGVQKAAERYEIPAWSRTAATSPRLPSACTRAARRARSCRS